LPTSSPARRLISALTLALSLAVLVTALLAPSQTLAQTHRPACSTSAAHPKTKRTAHACVQPSHRGQDKGKSNASRASKRHQAKRTVAKKTPKARPPASPALAPAYCEDGSAPARATDGSFSCGDGSEPECEDGSTPTRSRSGLTLVCPVLTEGESGSSEAECEESSGSVCGTEPFSSTEPACEDGSAPVRLGSGSYFCDDGSELICEDGSSPTSSSDGSTLACDIASGDARES